MRHQEEGNREEEQRYYFECLFQAIGKVINQLPDDLVFYIDRGIFQQWKVLVK